MKSAFLLAALAVAINGLAITATWDLKTAGAGTATTNGGTLYSDIWGNASKTGTWAFKAVYAMSSMTGTTALAIGPKSTLPAGYGGEGKTPNWRSTPSVSVRDGTNGTKSSLGLFHASGQQNGPYAYDPVSGPIAMVITLKWTSGNSADVAFYCNGDHLLTLSNQYVPDYVDSVYFGKDVVVKEAALYAVSLTDEQAKALSRAPLPEPTALAMLALGVMGLALRRRAA